MTCHPKRKTARRCSQPEPQLDSTIDQLLESLERIQGAWAKVLLALREFQMKLDQAQRQQAAMRSLVRPGSNEGSDDGK